MDTVGKLIKSCKNDKGMAVVWLAVIIVVALAFVGLAVDIGYMYVTKGQLQNAADAAALAGGSVLTQSGTNDLVQSAARAEATKFANRNYAAGESVQILDNRSNELSDTNDITVGNWDGAAYHRGITPVNAVEVRPRRVASSNALIKPVEIFFGKILSLAGGANWTHMGASASAVAGRVLEANGPIALCVKACKQDELGNPIDGEETFPGGQLMYWAPYPKELMTPDQKGARGIAWTVFSTSSPYMDKTLLASYFCGNKNDSCLVSIYATNANDNEMQKEFYCAFKNPNFDSSNKECSDGDRTCGLTASSGSNVIKWTITVPVFENAGCPPGASPDPYKVVKYAQVTLTDIYASGGGGNRCACQAYSLKAPTGSYPNAIVVEKINCITCGTNNVFGNVTKLVQ